MSGIAGYYSNNKPTKKVLKAMTDRIAHRGPDGEGHYLDDNIALGHRLLQTTKKIKGTQPLLNKTKDIMVVSDSVINNYTELKSELEKKKYHFNRYAGGWEKYSWSCCCKTNRLRIYRYRFVDSEAGKTSFEGDYCRRRK